MLAGAMLSSPFTVCDHTLLLFTDSLKVALVDSLDFTGFDDIVSPRLLLVVVMVTNMADSEKASRKCLNSCVLFVVA